MTICRTCKINKPDEAFSIARRNTGGRAHHCKECDKRNRQNRGYEDKRKNSIGYKEYSAQRFKEYAQNPRGRAIYMFNAAKKRAKEKNLEFDISVEFIELFLKAGVCFKTGFRFDLKPRGRKVRNPYAPSLDRIDSSKGYTHDNVQIVCDMYNHGKGQHTDAEFIAFCHRVALMNPIGGM